jgi:hypothetical protein
MAARIDNGRVQILTRTGLDWTSKYPSAAAALANLNIKTAYVDGELCGVDEAGLPSFANTQAATDGERGVQLVYYAFDPMHLDGWDVGVLPVAISLRSRPHQRGAYCPLCPLQRRQAVASPRRALRRGPGGLAEKVGFEPTVDLRLRRFSRPLP